MRAHFLGVKSFPRGKGGARSGVWGGGVGLDAREGRGGWLGMVGERRREGGGGWRCWCGWYVIFGLWWYDVSCCVKDVANIATGGRGLRDGLGWVVGMWWWRGGGVGDVMWQGRDYCGIGLGFSWGRASPDGFVGREGWGGGAL